MAREHRVRAVAEVRGKRCAGAYGIGDLPGGSPRVTDARDHSLLNDGFDEARRLQPLGRKRHQANISARGVLHAAKLIEIGRADPARWMCAARAVVGRNVRALKMECFYCGAFGEGLLGVREIAQSRAHVVWRAGDHGGEKARHAAGEHRTNGARDLLVSGCCRVVVDTGETVHLQIDKAGGDERRIL